MVTGSCDTIRIRCYNESSFTYSDLFSIYHDSLSRLVVYGEFCSLKSRIALGVSLVKVIVDLRKLDPASLDSVIALDLLIVGLDVEIISSVLSDLNYKDLIIDKISFRCFDLLDQICSKRIAGLAVLVLIQSVIGKAVREGRILSVDLPVCIGNEMPCPERGIG